MIHWLQREDGEGEFSSKVFCNEDGEELSVYANSEVADFVECAEKCVETFNNLSEAVVNEICKKIIECAKEGGLDEEFELPALDSPLDILNYCWFQA